jgi:prephenate dehydrogenase
MEARLPERIGIMGYGRFGRALGELLMESGFSISAFDISGVVGAEGADRPEQLVARSDIVLLAVPIAAMRGALDELRPHLGPRHLVLDVGSVKVMPMGEMEAVLGSAVPWAGTHPLFGPTSLALGERPLRVVVCGSTQHPAAPARARALFEAAGCEVVEQDARAHDRAMAETHALAYFVAKGMMNSRVQLDSENAPPSSRAMLRTVEAVRSDAGHLFAALHLDNPFAEGVRRRFLDALEEIDRSLRETDPAREAEVTGPMSIPDLGTHSPEIREVRDLIDDVDREIMTLLARRLLLARRAGRAKAELGAGVRDPQREAQLLNDRRSWAETLGLDPDEIAEIFQAVVQYSRRIQRADIAGT